jgi:LDH2 family malate/lactate/ureidoglycolate dehydrogenase
MNLTAGYKGYGLAVMVEMFCSMLSGSLCGYNMEVGVHDVDCVVIVFINVLLILVIKHVRSLIQRYKR